MGSQSVSVSGNACQAWWLHSQDDGMFPDATVADAQNFCRNVGSTHPQPVCYTSQGLENCDIPMCATTLPIQTTPEASTTRTFGKLIDMKFTDCNNFFVKKVKPYLIVKHTTTVLPDGTKPLPEPMLANHQWGLLAFTLGQSHINCSRYLSRRVINIVCLNIECDCCCVLCLYASCVCTSLFDILYSKYLTINTLRPRQDGHYFADDVLKCIFLNENVWISLKIPLKFVPRGPINNIPALVQIMAWRRPGDKPLSAQMLVFVATHICVTRPQWVKIDSWRVVISI